MAAIDFPNSPAVNDVFTAGNATYKWSGVAWVSNVLGQISWADVTGKPTTFAPSAHTHVKADVTDFAHTHVKADVTDFAHTHVKADVTDFAHVHPTSEVTGLDTALAGKAPTVHTHTISQITDYVAPAQPPHPFLTMGA